MASSIRYRSMLVTLSLYNSHFWVICKPIIDRSVSLFDYPFDPARDSPLENILHKIKIHLSESAGCSSPRLQSISRENLRPVSAVLTIVRRLRNRFSPHLLTTGADMVVSLAGSLPKMSCRKAGLPPHLTVYMAAEYLNG